jgi:serine/threonine protein kinase
MSEAAAEDPLIGTVIAERYRVDAKIGDGGMGAVYRVEHTHMRKRLALKVLHRELCAYPEIVARFEREAMAAANIEHPNVANATDFGKLADGTFYLVLEYVEGLDLRQLLQRDRALEPARAAHIALQILGALGRAHELGIVHRDLKPENILLVEKEHDREFAKVLDFGIARVPVGALGTQRRTGRDLQPLTRAGTVYGTPEYMAPEQALGESVDGRADLYALGVLLFEMVSGARPYDDVDKIALLGAHVSKPIPSLAQKARGPLPDGLEALVTRALAKKPDERFQTAAEFAGALFDLGFDAPMPTTRHLARSAEPRQHVDQEAASAGADPRPAVRIPAEGSVPADKDAELATTARAAAIASPPAASGLAPQQVQPRAPALVAGPTEPPAHAMERASSRAPWVVAATSVAASVVAVVFLRRPMATPAVAPSPIASASYVASAAPPVPASADPKELALRALGRVASGEIEAGLKDLEALVAAQPGDAAVLRAMAQGYAKAQKTALELATLDKLVHASPGAFAEPAVALLFVDVLADAATGEQAVQLLVATPKGPKLLYDLAFDDTIKPAARSRAARALREPKHAKALPAAVRALAELRAAGSCPARKSVLDKKRSDLDAEAVPLLRAMRKPTCGPDHKQTCWPCLKDKDLDALLATLESKP